METVNLICFKCRHYVENEGCAAFPGGIPDEILETNQHSKPLPWQENSIVFEPIKREDDAAQNI